MEEYIPEHYLQERFWSVFVKNNFISCKEVILPNYWCYCS